jgi:hypothetical protein
MDSSRKDGDTPKPGEAPARPGEPAEDRDAILSRRKFLIESALASAGITIGVAGCGPSKKDPGPQVCLSVAPQPPPPDAAFAQPPPPRPTVCLQPQVCLSPPPQPQECLKIAPQKCLKFAPPRERPDGGTPRPCLSRPRVCLSVAPKKPPSGNICLSFNNRE